MVQAYIAVPSERVAKILTEGYTCTKRNAVPCQFVARRDAASAHTNMHKDKQIVVLEVRDVDESLFERDENGFGGRIKLKHLPPNHLSDGTVIKRSEHGDGTKVPCPHCGKQITASDENRGKVGVAKYFYDGEGSVAYLGSNCCADKWKARQERLDRGDEKELYHLTSRDVANQILAGDGKFIRGGKGNAGGGIYISQRPSVRLSGRRVLSVRRRSCSNAKCNLEMFGRNSMSPRQI